MTLSDYQIIDISYRQMYQWPYQRWPSSNVKAVVSSSDFYISCQRVIIRHSVSAEIDNYLAWLQTEEHSNQGCLFAGILQHWPVHQIMPSGWARCMYPEKFLWISIQSHVSLKLNELRDEAVRISTAWTWRKKDRKISIKKRKKDQNPLQGIL